MFERATRMRYATDCGIAALATATGNTWSRCKRETGPHGETVTLPDTYYGIEHPTMARAIRKLCGRRYMMPSGSRLADAHGARGVVLCTVEHEGDWLVGRRHWLAWERDEHGAIWCFNPTDGEVFRVESMTGRGFFPVLHYHTA